VTSQLRAPQEQGGKRREIIGVLLCDLILTWLGFGVDRKAGVEMIGRGDKGAELPRGTATVFAIMVEAGLS
jgi:hypothetical protein